MSVIWVVLVVASVVTAALQGKMAALTASITSSAQTAVTLSIGLVGVLTLWLGLMRVAEEAGIVALFARGAKPVLRRLFPEVPPDHPAMGAMVMNVAANLLGLGNAATPFGIEAMRRLDDLNPVRGTASNAQALFCALNTASIQLIPATVLGLRAAAGARNPADIVGPTLVATACATVAAVVAAKALSRFSHPGRLEIVAAPLGRNDDSGAAVPGIPSPGERPVPGIPSKATTEPVSSPSEGGRTPDDHRPGRPGR